jgi:hypothetical protein
MEVVESVNANLPLFKLIDPVNVTAVLRVEELAKDECLEDVKVALPECELVLPVEVIDSVRILQLEESLGEGWCEVNDFLENAS